MSSKDDAAPATLDGARDSRPTSHAALGSPHGPAWARRRRDALKPSGQLDRRSLPAPGNDGGERVPMGAHLSRKTGHLGDPRDGRDRDRRDRTRRRLRWSVLGRPRRRLRAPRDEEGGDEGGSPHRPRIHVPPENVRAPVETVLARATCYEPGAKRGGPRPSGTSTSRSGAGRSTRTQGTHDAVCHSDL
jgi:hypothetical protein